MSTPDPNLPHTGADVRDWWSAPDAAPTGDRRANDPRADIVVMGCGRSGTSMVTGMLAEAGWFVGDDPYPPRDANAKGFFETAEINGINERLLSAAVRDEAPLGHMQHWLVATREPLEFEHDPALVQRMQRLVARGPIAFKDPRFCFTLPAWREALGDARYVCVFRDPSATARSLVKECADADYLRDITMTYERALEIWDASYRRVIDEHCETGDWLFVHFDELLTPTGVAKLEAFAGGRVAADFPEARLRRSAPAGHVPLRMLDTYDELRRLAGMPASSPAVATPRSAAPELSVVVCTYNRLDTLKRCLTSFEHQTANGRYEVVVVNDGATDGTRDWLSQWRPNCAHRVVHRENGGLAAARNTGLENARGQYVLLVNDDTIAFEDLVERHLAAHASTQDEVAVLGTFEQPRHALDNALMRVLERTNLVFCYASLESGERYDWTRFWTCNVSVSRDAVRRVGAFDESFQHYGCEDTDLAFRLFNRSRIPVLYDASARAHHEHVLTFDDFRRRARTVAGAWVAFFAKHPMAIRHPDWQHRLRHSLAGHEAALIQTLPDRGRAEGHARELGALDLGALERSGPNGAEIARAVEKELAEWLDLLNRLWWFEGEADAFRRHGVDGMHVLVRGARPATVMS